MQHSSKGRYEESLRALSALPEKYRDDTEASVLRLVVLFGLREYAKLLASFDHVLESISTNTGLSSNDRAYLIAYVSEIAFSAYLRRGGGENIPAKYVANWDDVRMSSVSRHLVRNFQFRDPN